MVVQAILSALAAGVVHRATRVVTGSDRAALVAGLVAAIDPFQVFFAALALSETLYILLLVLALERLASARTLAGGALMGAAALTRAMGLPHALALGLAVLLRPAPAMRARLAAALLYAAGFALVLAPWVARNAGVYGALVPVAIGSGFTLFESNNPLFSDGPWPPGLDVPRPPPGLTPLAADRWYAARAWAYIRENPGDVAGRALRRELRLFDPVPHAPGYSGGKHALVSAVVMVPLYVLAAFGFARLDAPGRWLLGLPVGATVAVHLLILGSVRYRLPLMPILAALAGAAFTGKRAGGSEAKSGPRSS